MMTGRARVPYRVSIVGPVFNEADDLARILDEARLVVGPLLEDYELIIIDDNSLDGTGTIADELSRSDPHVRVIHNREHQGFGRSYLRGVAEAKFEYVMPLELVDELLPSSVQEILKHIGEADVVIGEAVGPGQPSPISSKLFQFLSGNRLHFFDGLNGWPIAKRTAIKKLTVTSTETFISEIVAGLIRAGCTFVEVTVPARERRPGVFYPFMYPAQRRTKMLMRVLQLLARPRVAIFLIVQIFLVYGSISDSRNPVAQKSRGDTIITESQNHDTPGTGSSGSKEGLRTVSPSKELTGMRDAYQKHLPERDDYVIDYSDEPTTEQLEQCDKIAEEERKTGGWGPIEKGRDFLLNRRRTL